MLTKERTTSKPFNSKYYGRCPLGPEGVHPIRVGDLVVKVSPGFQWSVEHSSAIYGRVSRWAGTARTEYVHKECFDAHDTD